MNVRKSNSAGWRGASTEEGISDAPIALKKRRAAMLERIQQLIHEKVMFAPIWEIGGLSGVGPRVEEPALGLIAGYPFLAPYEDVKLRRK